MLEILYATYTFFFLQFDIFVEWNVMRCFFRTYYLHFFVWYFTSAIFLPTIISSFISASNGSSHRLSTIVSSSFKHVCWHDLHKMHPSLSIYQAIYPSIHLSFHPFKPFIQYIRTAFLRCVLQRSSLQECCYFLILFLRYHFTFLSFKISYDVLILEFALKRLHCLVITTILFIVSSEINIYDMETYVNNLRRF